MSNYNFSYFNNNDDNENEMDQLDRMARELNEKKKKFDLIKDVHNDFYEETQKNKKLLDEALKEENFRYFSTQGNINPTSNSNFNSNSKSILENNFDNKNNDSFLKSLDNYDKKKKKSDISYDSKSRDENLSILLDHLKKEHNSHIFSESESIVSDSEESIIKHLKKCSKCKNKIQLVFDDNHNKKKNIDSEKSNSLTIKFSDLKEYLIIILLGFLIILIIYIFFKFK